MDFRLENEVPMSAQELWRTVQTLEFNAFMAKELQPYPHIRLERQSSGDMIRRRLSISLSNVGMPHITRKAANKVLGGDEIVYEEIQGAHLDRFQMPWKIRPPVLTKKFHASGVLRLAPIDESRCLRIMEGRIHVGLCAVGSLLERMIAEQVKSTSDQFSDLVTKWKYENAR